jgi:hypothetical protein
VKCVSFFNANIRLITFRGFYFEKSTSFLPGNRVNENDYAPVMMTVISKNAQYIELAIA